jgi:hypothetical protein
MNWITKNGIPSRLLVNHLRRRVGALRLAAKRARQQLSQIVAAQWRENNVVQHRADLTHDFEGVRACAPADVCCGARQNRSG